MPQNLEKKRLLADLLVQSLFVNFSAITLPTDTEPGRRHRTRQCPHFCSNTEIDARRFIGVSWKVRSCACLSEDLSKITPFSVPDFQKHVLRLLGCSHSHSAFSQAQWIRKSIWFGMFYLQALTGHFYKNFETFRKFRDNTQVTRVFTRTVVSSPQLTSRF